MGFRHIILDVEVHVKRTTIFTPCVVGTQKQGVTGVSSAGHGLFSCGGTWMGGVVRRQ